MPRSSRKARISKRGNKYLRTLFVQAARVVLLRPRSWERKGLKPWIEAAARRLFEQKGNSIT
jgi:transposase